MGIILYIFKIIIIPLNILIYIYIINLIKIMSGRKLIVFFFYKKFYSIIYKMMKLANSIISIFFFSQVSYIYNYILYINIQNIHRIYRIIEYI